MSRNDQTRETPRGAATVSLMNKKYILIGVIVVLVIVGILASSMKSPQRFVQNASIGNQFEIMSSQVALQRSKNKEVTDFAQQMIDDHTHAADQLKTVVSGAGSNLPQPTDKLDAKHQDMLDKLNAASDQDFDKLYIDDQVSAHNEAVSLFDSYAQHGSNDALKNFAATTLPTLQQHQQHVQQIKASF